MGQGWIGNNRCALGVCTAIVLACGAGLLLGRTATYRYPNEIGPGVYDIHAPRLPSIDEMAVLLDKAKEHLSADQIWVNPDCGLKTRKWEEVRPALVNMVQAAKRIRADAR